MVVVEEFVVFNTWKFRPKVKNGNFLKIMRKSPKKSFIELEKTKIDWKGYTGTSPLIILSHHTCKSNVKWRQSLNSYSQDFSKLLIWENPKKILKNTCLALKRPFLTSTPQNLVIEYRIWVNEHMFLKFWKISKNGRFRNFDQF